MKLEALERVFGGNKKIRIGMAIISVVLVGYGVLYGVLSTPGKPSSTKANCELVHDIIVKDDKKTMSFKRDYLMNWDNYKNQTLFNLGLDSGIYRTPRTFNKWNGKWIMDEDFVKEYVATYSLDELLVVYNKYVLSYLHLKTHCFTDRYYDEVNGSTFDNEEAFWRENAHLLDLISETTDLIAGISPNSDSFCPTSDRIVDRTEKTEKVTGEFNVGSDNHIVTESRYLTTETIVYEDYEIVHKHGYKYDEGIYKWINGTFYDVKPSWKSVDEYYLYKDDKRIDGPVGSLEELKTDSITIGGEPYYVREITGKDFYLGIKEPSLSFNYPFSVRFLTPEKGVGKKWRMDM